MRHLRVKIAAGVLLAAATTTPAFAQDCLARGCVAVNLSLISAGFGYGMGTTTGLGATPDRTMRGLNLRLDVHILSLALRRLPIATYDALFTDMTYGKMNSTPLTFLSQPEGTSSLPFTFGYTFLAGVRREGIAVMGGLTYQHFNHDIGDSPMSGSGTAFTARVELGARRHFVLTGWAGSMLGGRVDVPLFRNLNLSAMYWQADGTVEPWNQPSGTKVPGKAKLLMVGFRTAELR